jgi:hypothetical protein
MSLHGPTRHLELARNLGVVTALQEQFDNLLFARSKPNGLLRHHCPHGFGLAPALDLCVAGMFPEYIASTMPF